jgi:hypothetical protein
MSRRQRKELPSGIHLPDIPEFFAFGAVRFYEVQFAENSQRQTSSPVGGRQ